MIRLLHRGIALKSNRSQDPVVVTNIKLSNCKDLNDVFQIMKETQIQRQNRFFALRIIARLVQNDRGQAKFFGSETYLQLIKEVNESFADIKSLELTDLSYFIKVTQEYGMKNLTIDPNVYEEKVEAAFKNNSLTVRQMTNIFQYGQLSGFVCKESFDSLFLKLFSTEYEFLSMVDVKNFARALKMQRVGNNERLTQDYVRKVEEFDKKETFEVSNFLYIAKNLAIVEKLRGKQLEYRHYVKKSLENLDVLSESDYGMIFKYDRDNPGSIDPGIIETLVERVKKSVEKRSARLSISFLIDCIPMLRNDEKNAELINMIVDYTIEKLQKKEMRIITFSKLCLNIIDKPREQLNYVFSNKLLNVIASGSYLDILLFRGRYSSKSIFQTFGINDTHMDEYIHTRTFKTLMHHYKSFKPFENSDIQLINEKIKQKFIDFISVGPLNARCMFGLINELEFNHDVEDDCFLFLKPHIQEQLLKEFNHLNLMNLMLIVKDHDVLRAYFEKFRGKVEGDALGIMMVENCNLISESVKLLLAEVFGDKGSVQLAYVIQGLRTGKWEKKILHNLKRFNAGDLQRTQVWRIYTEESVNALQVSQTSFLN